MVPMTISPSHSALRNCLPESVLLYVTATVWHQTRLFISVLTNVRDLYLISKKRMLTLDGEEIHLTPVEYKIVAYLARNSGKVMTYASVMANVWGPFTDNNNRILRVNMANIRRKNRTESITATVFIYRSRCRLSYVRR